MNPESCNLNPDQPEIIFTAGLPPFEPTRETFISGGRTVGLVDYRRLRRSFPHIPLSISELRSPAEFDNAMIEVTALLERYVNVATQTAQEKGLTDLDFKLQWRNIPNSETNPNGENGFFRLVVDGRVPDDPYGSP